jgi:hypothetical protein
LWQRAEEVRISDVLRECAGRILPGSAQSVHETKFMPLTVFDTKGVPAIRRERIEAAVEAGGKHVVEPYEACIATDQRARCEWSLRDRSDSSER